ncbi:DEAD/DEAH box helicase [Blastomonas fulva]|uniref:DEAD/DEAH box helicase n=1 Tax=Blastomonas fulva TaxID=1550728 RepID=UPI003F6E5F05
MSDWIYDSLSNDDRLSAARSVDQSLLIDLTATSPIWSPQNRFTAQTYEFAVSVLLDDPESADLRNAAELAFETLRAAPAEGEKDSRADQLLHTSCYGILADRTPDVARYLRGAGLADLWATPEEWGERVRARVTKTWLLLLRKDGWADLDAVQAEILLLREEQKSAERDFLAAAQSPRGEAWNLIAIYHLARAAEILATFSAQGIVGRAYDVREQLQAQFDRSLVACDRAELAELHGLVRLLAATAEKLVANSIWAVTRAVNSRVTRFVERLAGRDNPHPIFEMLPPQRITLREQGLLGSGYRAVLVSLPTSSGKTFIAQFRMLQALNQFDADRGWVAYVAPTRALVNQICARLRRDFAPLGIVVERISPALEIDGVEAELLADRDPNSAFRVLVGTPEKIDLLLRGGWEAKIGRPLTLVVVDEAHNLSNLSRGLKLELLLATINRECRQSQFLLLTPFISNGGEVARWLSPDSHNDISIGFDWRPNDRAIVLAKPARGKKRGNFAIHLETLHTSRPSIELDEEIEISEGRDLGLTFSEVSNSLSNVAAVTASCLNRRGTVIVVAGKVSHCWTIARTLMKDAKFAEREAERQAREDSDDGDLNFVADFVASEYGDDFELVELLRHRIGLHHSGLSDETRVLMEWLVERGALDTVVATTTIAQGVNFPVSGVILASHLYPYGEEMAPEEFWNLAGRAGRADQVGTGIIALAACDDAKAETLRKFVRRQVSELNSTLVEMVQAVLRDGQHLELHTLYWKKEWSAFLQYLAHSYRQIGDHSEFASQIEQVLRGSFGFQKLRQLNANDANKLVAAVHDYASILNGKPLALVDATGFSWESVSLALANVRGAHIDAGSWVPERIFQPGDTTLERAFGVLFRIPEIREELIEVTGGGRGGDGNKLARMVKDWVGGLSIPDIAKVHFADEDGDNTAAITRASRAVHGKLAMTASWGVSALQALTGGDVAETMSAEELATFRNLPSRIFYGVNSDAAIDLRLIGVPRSAAEPLAAVLAQAGTGHSVHDRRAALAAMDDEAWKGALGSNGAIYRRAWRVLEGQE